MTVIITIDGTNYDAKRLTASGRDAMLRVGMRQVLNNQARSIAARRHGPTPTAEQVTVVRTTLWNHYTGQ